jgi:hypothetical protein
MSVSDHIDLRVDRVCCHCATGRFDAIGIARRRHHQAGDFSMISGVSAIGAGMNLQPPSAAAAAVPGASDTPEVPPARDVALISAQGKAFLDAEILGLALIIALLRKPGNKDKESNLIAELAITAMVLQSMARLSPFIMMSETSDGRTYALVGSIQAASEAATANNMAALFTDGVPAMTGAIGGAV